MNQEYTFNVDMQALVVTAVILGSLGALSFFISKIFDRKAWKFFGSLTALSALGVIACTGWRIHNYREFSARFDDHIKAAYNAKTAEEAQLQYTRAMEYVKSKGCVEGSTAVLYPSPEYNVGDWYGNLEKVEEKLNNYVNFKNSLISTITLTEFGHKSGKDIWKKFLEESDLVKVSPLNGQITEVKSPEGISRYPNTVNYFVYLLSCFVSFLFNGFMFVVKTRHAW